MTEQPQLQFSGKEPSLFNGKKLLSRAIDYWYLYVLSLLVCLSYAWFKIHYATPMYKVYGQIIVQDDKSSGGNSQALSGGSVGNDFSTLFSGKVNMENELPIFQTSDLYRKMVRDMKLYISYYHKGSVRSVELYNGSPVLVDYRSMNGVITPFTLELKFPSTVSNQFTVAMNGKKFLWHFNDTLYYNNAAFYFTNARIGFDTTATYLVQIQDPEAIAGAIAGGVSAALLTPKSSIVNLVYNTNLPQKGEDILRGVMKAYINRSVEQKNITSDSTIQFINSRVALVGNDLNNIESTIQQFKERNKITDLTAQSQQLVSRSNDYYQQLSTLQVEIKVIETMLEYVKNEQNNRRPVPALLNTDATFGGLVGAYNNAQVERDKLLLSLKETNPIASNLNTQIAGLRGDIVRSLQSQKEALSISEQRLISQNSMIASEIQKVPDQERRFLDFTREQNVKQALYLFLLQRREEIAIAKASNSSNASIISSPRASGGPYEPNTSTYYTIALLLALALPTTFVMLRYLLNNKVENREDVTDVTPATILAEVGHSHTQGMLDLKNQGRAITAEQFRIFRTNMDFAIQNKPSPVVMVTSCLSGEGKSFIAANLGQIYAISGKKVILVELDLRRPKLSRMLNANNDVGFSNYIIGDKPVGEFIQKIQSNNTESLFLLPSGPIPPNPAELLLSQKVPAMFAELRKQFDLILVDTAPIGAVTDAQIIGGFADISLYIVRKGYSIKNSIEIVNDILMNNKLPSFYLILNDMKEGASYKYGYGYQYSYGYGYMDKTKANKKWWQLR